MPPRFHRVRSGRALRTRTVAAVALMALVPAAAACRPAKKTAPPPPPPPAVYCAPTTPTDASGYQAAFDAMFAANTGAWVASDGGYPFALPDGRVLWFFGDTLVGSHPPGGPVSGFLVNNGFVVQDGPCFRPMIKPIPDPVAGEWIWPTGAIVEGNKLRVFGLHMRTSGGSFGFEFVRVDVATFSLPDLTFEGSQALPVPLQADTSRPSYGETVTVVADGADTWVYAYGHTKESGAFGIPFANHYVARAPLGDVLVATAWEFWHEGGLVEPLDPPGWTDDADAASPMLFDPDPDDLLSLPDPDDGPVAPFPVTARAGGDFLGSALAVDVLPSDLETWVADAPEGPWERVGVAVDVPDYTAGGSGRFAYGGRVVIDLPGVAAFAFWSTNHQSFAAVLANPELYKVVFATPAASSIPSG